jgi:hypothetical protein
MLEQEKKMNNDLFINDQYHPEGALEIELRVREREKQLALITAEERLEEANHPVKRTMIAPVKIFLNIF